MRDHFTFTAPIFGRFSRPLPVIDQRALAVNRIDCRLSLRDLNRGAPIFGPLRLPLREAKKFRYAVSASAQGLLEHDRGDLAQPGPLRRSASPR